MREREGGRKYISICPSLFYAVLARVYVSVCACGVCRLYICASVCLNLCVWCVRACVCAFCVSKHMIACVCLGVSVCLVFVCVRVWGCFFVFTEMDQCEIFIILSALGEGGRACVKPNQLPTSRLLLFSGAVLVTNIWHVSRTKCRWTHSVTLLFLQLFTVEFF